ncbi:endonuclease [Romboutsia maritimum]|uniref:Endonuclease n=1 Tax=Romboutsia maritimum TaxID=2020948 RepID=A0A371ITW4_9FIRM|nr:endonuclease/exonuclease/phosphatase family protein [Romboutsia maritimum]RDY23911.1 endonuclease [Romboutsia maritimum]
MKIVTYNIHQGMDSNNKYTLNKLGKYLKKLDWDVICLQEVLYHQFKKIKSDLNMNGVFADNVNKPGKIYGICTFTKQKIENSNHMYLTSKKEQRGFLCVTINEKDINFNIINTHLGLDKYERYNQISEMLDYTNRLIGDIIICGDFNERHVSLSKYIDISIGLTDKNIETFEKSKARIDYIFVDKYLNPKEYYVDKSDLSDHYPVIGEI